jgi:hypothetical protein
MGRRPERNVGSVKHSSSPFHKKMKCTVDLVHAFAKLLLGEDDYKSQHEE